jgi:type II secretory ATPase GspE/PulE/Tfp pilus assembly ATPase PilB-like protein
MGVEPYLAASSIVGVLAQRLVRMNCKSCSKPHRETDDALIALGLKPEDYRIDFPFMKGEGCDKCGGTGFRGRRGVFELLAVDDEVRRMTVEREPASHIRTHALKNQGMRTLLGDGRLAVLEGATTAKEVLRVCQRDDIL